MNGRNFIGKNNSRWYQTERVVDSRFCICKCLNLLPKYFGYICVSTLPTFLLKEEACKTILVCTISHQKLWKKKERKCSTNGSPMQHCRKVVGKEVLILTLTLDLPCISVQSLTNVWPTSTNETQQLIFSLNHRGSLHYVRALPREGILHPWTTERFTSNEFGWFFPCWLSAVEQMQNILLDHWWCHAKFFLVTAAILESLSNLTAKLARLA